MLQAITNSPQKIISRTIWILSLVSLFTDVASEMLYPVMPLFLEHIGYTAVFIGVLEGVAEAVAGLSKSFFGKLSDQSGRRLPFIQMGYTLSAISKPMLAIFYYPWWIFLSRTMDRLGKGIRTGARDAMLADESTASTRGRVFGFHRGMDTLGAVIGPSIALVYLYFYPNRYGMLFLIAFVPGLAAIISTLLIREKKRNTNSGIEVNSSSPEKQIRKIPALFSFVTYWKKSSRTYRYLVSGLLLFALFNSADVFLLLRMKESGLTNTAVIGTYIFYNLAYALLAYPIGILADKLGLKKIFLAGLLVFAAVYTGFAFNHNLLSFIFLFFLYGLYAAATDGVSKAWISNIVDKTETATAIGTYSGFQSICALLASSLCGLLWYNFGSQATFLITAGMTLLAIIYLFRIKS